MASLPKRPTKKHVEYTSFETDAIIKGIKILGDNPGRWADIKRMFPVELAQRTPLQIRDRWFVVKKKLEFNDPQGSTSQVLNMTATQQAPTALVPKGNAHFTPNCWTFVWEGERLIVPEAIRRRAGINYMFIIFASPDH